MLTKKHVLRCYRIKPRRIRVIFIAWVNGVNDVRIIYGEGVSDLIKEAKRILNEITPIGQVSKASLWRNDRIIANVKFSNKIKKQPRV